MECLKCSKATEGDRVFCPDCLARMEHYPVRPGTAIRLPKRNESATPKKVTARKKTLSPEERISRLHKVIAWMSLGMAACAILLALTVTGWLDAMKPGDEIQNIGRNYSTTAD